VRRGRAELGLALGTVALGVCLLAGARAIDAGTGYDRIGPRVFPYAVGAGLIVLGALLGASPPRGAAGATHWKPVGYLALAFLLFLLLLDRAGFVVAAGVQFWLVCRAFGSARPVRDAAAALLLSIAVFLALSRGLGLTLPAGAFEGLFP
jgi:putative tricarboxylic transport membrane protein